MPRKNVRPAARKRREKLKIRMGRGAKYDARARPLIANPRLGDGVLLAALAAHILND